MAVFEFTGPGDLAAWMREPGSDAGVVVASRVRLSRNLRTHPYPGTCSAEEEVRLREEILEAIRHLPNGGEFAILYLDELAPLERRILFERGLIGQAFSLEKQRALALADDAGIAAVVCEEDHLRLAALGSRLVPGAPPRPCRRPRRRTRGIPAVRRVPRVGVPQHGGREPRHGHAGVAHAAPAGPRDERPARQGDEGHRADRGVDPGVLRRGEREPRRPLPGGERAHHRAGQPRDRRSARAGRRAALGVGDAHPRGAGRAAQDGPRGQGIPGPRPADPLPLPQHARGGRFARVAAPGRGPGPRGAAGARRAHRAAVPRAEVAHAARPRRAPRRGGQQADRLDPGPDGPAGRRRGSTRQAGEADAHHVQGTDAAGAEGAHHPRAGRGQALPLRPAAARSTSSSPCSRTARAWP